MSISVGDDWMDDKPILDYVYPPESPYLDMIPSDAPFIAGIRIAFIRTPDDRIAFSWSFDGPLDQVATDVPHALFKLGAEAGEWIMERIKSRVPMPSPESPEYKRGEMTDD